MSLEVQQCNRGGIWGFYDAVSAIEQDIQNFEIFVIAPMRSEIEEMLGLD